MSRRSRQRAASQQQQIIQQSQEKALANQERNLNLAVQQVATDTPFTVGYEAIPQTWFRQPRDMPPFSFMTVRAMLIDPTVREGLKKRSAPISKALIGFKDGDKWTEGIQCEDQAIGQWIFRQFKKIWTRFLPSILRAQVWGWSGSEIVLRLNKDGLLELDRLEPRHASDVRIVKQDHKRWGVSFSRIEEKGDVRLPFPFALFHAYNAEDGDDYGTSVLIGAYAPWAEKWFDGGARDVRRTFMHKDAYGGADLGYPRGQTQVNGQWVDNYLIARQLVEQMQSGAVTTRPSERDENGNEKWPLTRAVVTSNPAHILQYPKDLDQEIRRGMEIPDEADNAEATGAWAGKRVGQAAFYASLDDWVVQILADICEQFIDPVCMMNFGRIPEYSVEHQPLGDQAMQQQSNAGPGQQPQQPGMGDPSGSLGMDQQQPSDPYAQYSDGSQYQQPTMMSLSRIDRPIASVIESARYAVRERIRMSLDRTGHEHKGKGPGGGQFTAKGGGGNSSGMNDQKAIPHQTAENTQQSSSAPAGRKPTNEQQPAPVPNTKIESESDTPPPPGKAFVVDVEKKANDGVCLTARVGVPGRDVPPPPPIPRLPHLTPEERRAETDFIEAFQADPHGMAMKYRQLIAATSKPYTFETDQAKVFSDDWCDPDLDKQMKKRHLYNNALHQTSNAIVKLAFLQHLDTLKQGDNILVTVGGCGSGKGYTLKNTELGKNLTAEAKAVWDSAGDQNATENPWILEEAKKRGLTVTYAYVSGDPKVAWADPNRGVVKRAHDNADGRMVDAAVFADSYVLGAQNHHAFHQAYKDDPSAKFLFFSAKDQSQLPGVPEESLNMDRKSLYHWALGSIESRSDVAPTVLRGATAGARIWNEEFFGNGNRSDQSGQQTNQQ